MINKLQQEQQNKIKEVKYGYISHLLCAHCYLSTFKIADAAIFILNIVLSTIELRRSIAVEPDGR